ncbi:MAG: hypothetical protein ACOCUI_04230, partial [bacterium]
SKIFVTGDHRDVGISDPVKKINEGFRYLIESIYSKLHHINTNFDSLSDLEDLITSDKLQLHLGDNEDNKLAYKEVKKYLDRQNKRNLRVTFKSLVEKYTSVPYGWREYDLASVIIQLLKAKEISLQYNDENIGIKNNDILDYLTKKRYQEKLIIKKRVKVDQHLINNAKDIVRELFNKSSLKDDEDKLKEQMQILINNEYLTTINRYLREYNDTTKYPGEKELKEAEDKLSTIQNIDDTYHFFKELEESQEELKEISSKVSKVFGFFENQKEHFDKAIATLALYEKNKNYIENQELIETAKNLKTIVESDEPYEQVPTIPGLRDKFNNILFSQIIKEISESKEVDIKTDKEKVKNELEDRSYEFDEYFKGSLLNRFDELIDKLYESDNINEILAIPQESEVIKQRCFKEINKKISKMEEEQDGVSENDDPDTPKTIEIKEKEIENISMNNLFKTTKFIESDDDIEEVLNEIRTELKKILDEDKNIKLI